jgi:hypothetical protein
MSYEPYPDQEPNRATVRRMPRTFLRIPLWIAVVTFTTWLLALLLVIFTDIPRAATGWRVGFVVLSPIITLLWLRDTNRFVVFFVRMFRGLRHKVRGGRPPG